MRALGMTVALVAVLGFAGCGSDKPAMPEVTGKKLDVAKSAIKKAGFDDDVKVKGGGVFGVIIESSWEVCNQSPKAGATISGTPRLTVDRSCDDNPKPSTETPSAATPHTPKPQATETTQPTVEQTLTAKNSKDFAALLKVSDGCDDPVRQFAAKYAGKTIAFNGSIADLAPHGNYKTRFDILIYPGNNGPDSVVGPAFKFADVNLVYDIHLEGKNRPDAIGPGDLFHFVAKVGDYNPNQCLFFLEPVSTTAR